MQTSIFSLPAFKSIQLQRLGNLCIDTNISDNPMRVTGFIALKYINSQKGVRHGHRFKHWQKLWEKV